MRVSSRLPLDGFPRYLILVIFMEICRENPYVVKIGQKYRAHHVSPKYVSLLPAVLDRHKIALFE